MFWCRILQTPSIFNLLLKPQPLLQTAKHSLHPSDDPLSSISSYHPLFLPSLYMDLLECLRWASATSKVIPDSSYLPPPPFSPKTSNQEIKRHASGRTGADKLENKLPCYIWRTPMIWSLVRDLSDQNNTLVLGCHLVPEASHHRGCSTARETSRIHITTWRIWKEDLGRPSYK